MNIGAKLQIGWDELPIGIGPVDAVLAEWLSFPEGEPIALAQLDQTLVATGTRDDQTEEWSSEWLALSLRHENEEWDSPTGVVNVSMMPERSQRISLSQSAFGAGTLPLRISAHGEYRVHD